MKITNIPKDKHLTATEKRAIIAIIQSGLHEGKIGNKIYRIFKFENFFKVVIESKQSNDYGNMVTNTYSTTFNFSGV